MTEESPDGSGLRSTIAGATIAGGGAVVALLALSAANLGSPTIRAILAIGFGVVVAQLVERLWL